MPEDTGYITVEEYMVRQGQALTAYTQVFGAVVQMTLDAKVKLGVITQEQAAGILKSVGANLTAYLQKVNDRMAAKLQETKAPVFYDAKAPQPQQLELPL